MKLILLAICAAALPLCANSAPDQDSKKKEKEDRSSTTPALIWTRSGKNGVEEHASLAKTTKHGEAAIAVKKPNGHESIAMLSEMEVTTFRGSSVCKAKLPARVREKPTFINFIASATPGISPEDGSLINVDGAILTFVEIATPEGKLPRAQVYVRALGNDGKLFWMKLNWLMSLNASALTVSPPIGVRIDHANNTWSLFHNDLLIAGDLPLFSKEKLPTISIRAGAVATDTFLLKDLKISSIPRGRNAELRLPAKNGIIDFADAEHRHDLRLRPAGHVTMEKKVSTSSDAKLESAISP